MNLRIILISISFFTILFYSCLDQSFSLKELPKEWAHLTKTDSGFVHKTHYNNGSILLNIQGDKFIQLFMDQMVIELDVGSVEEIDKKNIKFEGQIKFSGRANGLDSKKGICNFKWIDKEKDLAYWAIVAGKDTILQEYFTSYDEVEKLPIVTYGGSWNSSH